jgi:hypothetical protein
MTANPNTLGSARENMTAKMTEYPLASKRRSRIQSLPEAEVRAIYDKEWRQYSEWRTRA